MICPLSIIYVSFLQQRYIKKPKLLTIKLILQKSYWVWKSHLVLFRLNMICFVWILLSRTIQNLVLRFFMIFCRMWLCVILILFFFYNFTAESAGIPFLSPYLNKDALFVRGHGVNFAVAGATALPLNVPGEKNNSIPFADSSLSVQLDWMSTFFSNICFDHDG